MSIKGALLRLCVSRNKFINITAIAVRGSHNDTQGKYENNNNYKYKYFKITAALFSSVLVGTAISDSIDRKKNVQNVSNKKAEAGERKPDLPTYRAEEVSKHNTKSDFWVTYRNGVYDVTSFLPSHPGGEQIMNAAGFSIEPFWNVYGMHKTDEIYTLLESYRIGNLHSDDVVDHSDEELWAREPARDPRLRVKTARPFNAETPPDVLADHFDTPNALFYVRQHMPVPELDASHRLTVVVGKGGKRQQFSLQDLESFPKVTFRAALMCAGNRRSEMNKVKPVKGLGWEAGAVSSAAWRGVLLRDVLLRCGVDAGRVRGRHVILQGADIDATGVNFSTSIPLHMALSPSCRVLLATHMNGAPLPPDHGAPLRAVVPGAPAVRSVKWLESITVSEDESPSHWHQKDYRSFNPSTTWETADFSTAPPVYSLPVTSAICDPLDGATVPVKDSCIEVRGYAYSGGGAKILRVDITADGGRTWQQADRMVSDSAPATEHYAWTLWAVRVPVTEGQKEVELWAKATDSNFNTQPERFDDIWNIRGILSNAYHRIKVQLKH